MPDNYTDLSREDRFEALRRATEASDRLVPDGEFLETLASDYEQMAESGMLMSDAPPSFDEVMERCEGIAARANAAR